MRIRQQQRLYGTIVGSCAFLVGWVITYFITPEGFVEGVPHWQSSMWVWLNANFVPIDATHVHGLGGLFQQADLIAEEPMFHGLRPVPVLLTALGGVLLIDMYPSTRRIWYLIQNSGSLLLGYVGMGLIAFTISDAQPGVSDVIGLIVVLGLVGYLGAAVIDRIVPSLSVFVFASVGTIVLVGLLILIGGILIIEAITPMIIVGTAGVVSATALVMMARKLPQ